MPLVRSIALTGVFLALALAPPAGAQNSLDLDVFFPRAFGIAVNQVGYMQGGSLDHEDGPWRAGIRRSFDVRDYRPIAEVGQAVGIRFMSLFALAEMDRLNIVATLPHATQAGTAFDNSANMGPEQIAIMDYVRDHAAHIELGVTGVGHEWWVDGVKTRSEWYDLNNRQPRDEAMMRRHLDVIRNILGQYRLNDEYGHSFPRSFSALGYYWNPDGDYSTGSLFTEYGVRYVNTKFGIIPELSPPPEKSAGFDHGVLVMDRGGYGNLWHAYAALPSEPVEAFETDLIESHWANWLAADDFLQPALNEEWIAFFRGIQEYPFRYLAKNTEQLYSQWLYREHTLVHLSDEGEAQIDNRAMPTQPYDYDSLGNLVLAVPLRHGEHVSRAVLDGEPVAAYFEDAGFGFLYLPPLQRRRYRLSWTLGDSPPPGTINNTGTYNVYGVTSDGSDLRFDVRMYGTQEVRFRVENRFEVRSGHAGLAVLDQSYDTTAGELVATIRGHDVQGERGEVILVRR
jgi:hypothetical protein